MSERAVVYGEDVTKEEAIAIVETLTRTHYSVLYAALDIIVPDWCWASFIVCA